MAHLKSHNWLIMVAAIALVALFSLTTRNQPGADNETTSTSVWAVDVVRTLPGMQDEYLRNIETNWAGARGIARERGVIVAYRAFAAEPDSLGEWDVLLMTEYPDSAAWANREAAFQEIFASPEFVRTPIDTPSAELRTFVEGGGLMRAVVSSP